MNKGVYTGFIYSDGINIYGITGDKASYITCCIKLLRSNQGISIKLPNAGDLKIIKFHRNFRKMADQGNIHIGKIYMRPQIFVDPGSNNAGDFSFEEIGCSPYESYNYKQGKPQNFEDFGFHSFSGI